MTELRPPGGNDWKRCTDHLLLMKVLHCLPDQPIEIWYPTWGNETGFVSLNRMPPILNTTGMWWRPA